MTSHELARLLLSIEDLPIYLDDNDMAKLEEIKNIIRSWLVEDGLTHDRREA